MSRRRTSSFDSLPVGTASDTRAVALADAKVTLTTPHDYAAEISRLWADAQRRFLEIGHHLLKAKENLPHGEFLPMLERDLPFSRSVANRLMAVAAAVKQEVIPPRLVPIAYSVAYQVVTLPAETLQQAVAEGKIRPDMTRSEAEALRPKKKTHAPAPDDERAELDALLAEQKRITARIAELRAKLGM